MVKNILKDNIAGVFPDLVFDILTPPNPELGDYSVNLPFILAKRDKKNPADIGAEIVEKLSLDKELRKYFDKIEFASPGFVNFYLSEDFLREQLGEILDKKDKFGSQENRGFKINLEFVSANPTGPLMVHNIRGAPYGDTLANILIKAGYDVTKEYYINDAGNQTRLLGESVARRYLRLKGKTIEFPDNLYQGEYIVDIAKEIEKRELIGETENFDNLVNFCKDYSVKKLIDSIKESLKNLSVDFDVWFSEKSLHDSDKVSDTLKLLEKGKHVYDKDGARWLTIDESGERDAVLVKSDGAYSYLMGDIAYSRDKFVRGFNRAINIWGADHHGDVPRLKAGVKSLAYDHNKLEIILHQMVAIKKKDELQRMSKRKGEFVLVDELLKDAGRDAIRFFFLMKDLSTHMEFDIDLAKEQSKKNPVFYIQYAYARLNQIFAKIENPESKIKNLESGLKLLKEPEEIRLMRKMAKFPELIEDISQNYQVHHLAQYTSELAGDFHNFYEKHQVVQDDKKLEKARLFLCHATAIILENALDLMGISAPKRMDNPKR